MSVKMASISILFFLALAGSASTAAPTSPGVRYYENGKRIPTPAQVPPIYPGKEFKRRIGGTTVIAFSHDEHGRVVSARVKTSSGNANLDKAAIAAVRQWTVSPTLKDGTPAPGESETPITFTP